MAANFSAGKSPITCLLSTLFFSLHTMHLLATVLASLFPPGIQAARLTLAVTSLTERLWSSRWAASVRRRARSSPGMMTGSEGTPRSRAISAAGTLPDIFTWPPDSCAPRLARRPDCSAAMAVAELERNWSSAAAARSRGEGAMRTADLSLVSKARRTLARMFRLVCRLYLDRQVSARPLILWPLLRCSWIPRVPPVGARPAGGRAPPGAVGAQVVQVVRWVATVAEGMVSSGHSLLGSLRNAGPSCQRLAAPSSERETLPLVPRSAGLSVVSTYVMGSMVEQSSFSSAMVPVISDTLFCQ